MYSTQICLYHMLCALTLCSANPELSWVSHTQLCKHYEDDYWRKAYSLTNYHAKTMKTIVTKIFMDIYVLDMNCYAEIHPASSYWSLLSLCKTLYIKFVYSASYFSGFM